MLTFNLSCLQVVGCYDAEAHLYRWAEMTDSASEHYQNKSEPDCYATAIMESASQFEVLHLQTSTP